MQLFADVVVFAFYALVVIGWIYIAYWIMTLFFKGAKLLSGKMDAEQAKMKAEKDRVK